MATLGLRWILNGWDAASGVMSAARGAVLVAEAGLAADIEAAIDLSLDELSALAAQVYVEQFGTTMAALLSCEHCSQVLEIDVPIEHIGAEHASAEGTGEAVEAEVTLGSGTSVRVRVPTTRDLVAVAQRDDVTEALISRCVSAVAGDSTVIGQGGNEPPLDLTEADRALVDAGVEQLAGATAPMMRARCPECRSRICAPVDMGALLWARVEQEAPARLAEVAVLASTFGWTEDDIVGMAPRRREAYLSLAQGGQA